MAYFACSTRLVAQAAEALGKTEDAKEFNDLNERIRTSFQKSFVAPDGRVKGNTQTAYALAIVNDLLTPEQTRAAAQHLVEDIQARDWHLSTGFVGTKDLMLALSKIGRTDVAYRLLQNDTFPSWGYSVKQGATSIWECWDGWTPEKGFQYPSMGSLSHYAYGAVYQLMVENIGGIRSDGVGYHKLLIAPQPGGTLTSARTSYRSIHGMIATDWRIADDRLTLNVAIPANTTATVILPTQDVTKVREGGKRLARAEGIKLAGLKEGRVAIEAGSGRYAFTIAGPIQVARMGAAAPR